MREIKFRAWCNYEKKMYYKFYIEEHMTYAFFCELIKSAKERYDLMQYTGLKDKNGTEIYEGDIVIENGRQVNHDVAEDYGKSFSYQKVWYDSISGSFRVGNLLMVEYLDLNLSNAENNSNLKVVGNVHEHPHLLVE